MKIVCKLHLNCSNVYCYLTKFGEKKLTSRGNWTVLNCGRNRKSRLFSLTFLNNNFFLLESACQVLSIVNFYLFYLNKNSNTLPGFLNYKKGALDSQPQVIKFINQLLAHGRWFSPGTPASSTTKTGRHDIAEILLKVALNTINQSINQINQLLCE